MKKTECVAMLLAGGQGSRLGVLTQKIAKPAVPYGGKYRIIDFPLSNCINSGIETVGVLTQYQPLELNDYILVGVQYGAGMSRMMWNPTQKQESVFMPYNFGITFTKYGKMFGYMPYFGFQAGIFLGQEGYKFKHNEELDYT